jgi:phosphoribosyl-ATP pyrophosphohydrolase
VVIGNGDARGNPAVILDESGQVLDVVFMNRKCYAKSVERGVLWTVNRETGRVLPYGNDVRYQALTDRGGWYRVVLRDASAVNLAYPETVSAPAQPVPGATNEGRDIARSAGRDGVLSELARVIADRKASRPEGSYTTYLFESGEEKIRKKTGEEAVELVLARNRNEIVSESADFLYHLLVLLSQLEIPVEDVLSELARRA